MRLKNQQFDARGIEYPALRGTLYSIIITVAYNYLRVPNRVGTMLDILNID